VNWCNFTDVYCDTCDTNPLALVTTGTGSINGAVFENQWASSGTADGIFVNGAGAAIDGVFLTNTRVLNNGNNGVNITGTVKNWHQIGGVVSGNSQSSVATYAGIAVSNTVAGSVFEGILVGPAMGLADIQLFSIALSANINHITIQGCNLNTAHTPIGFSTFGGGDVNFRDNLGFYNEARGENKVGSGTSSVNVTHGLSVTPAQSDIMITPVANILAASANTWWVSAVSSTTFTVTVNSATTGDWFFGWRAVAMQSTVY
jgi:hypothetical protein